MTGDSFLAQPLISIRCLFKRGYPSAALLFTLATSSPSVAKMAMNFVTFNQDYSYLAVGGFLVMVEMTWIRAFTDVSQPPPRDSAYSQQIPLPRAMRRKKGISL